MAYFRLLADDFHFCLELGRSAHQLADLSGRCGKMRKMNKHFMTSQENGTTWHGMASCGSHGDAKVTTKAHAFFQ